MQRCALATRSDTRGDDPTTVKSIHEHSQSLTLRAATASWYRRRNDRGGGKLRRRRVGDRSEYRCWLGVITQAERDTKRADILAAM